MKGIILAGGIGARLDSFKKVYTFVSLLNSIGRILQGGKSVITISLCMIVKNEENTIGNCLDSIHNIVDEMIIVDTGSTDKTKEICSQYEKTKIYDFKWIDNFSEARNYSFNLATKDYILWLDADDVLLEEDQKKLVHLKQTLEASVDSVTMTYHNGFDEYGNVTLSFRRNRLVKRINNYKWYGAVHEYLNVGGNILDSNITVTHTRVHHHSDRNLSIFEKRKAKGEKFSARDLFYYANELRDHGRLQKAAQYYKRFLNSEDGWVEDKISACDKLAEIYATLDKIDSERKFILKSFEYDTPRAELCCRMGYSYIRNKEYRKAAFWYELATKFEKPADSWGFFTEAYWTWIPHIQLCICYYHLGDYNKSYQHNEIVGHFRPQDQDYIHNKKLLESILK